LQDDEALSRELHRIDGRGYPAYKDLRGSYAFPDFTLHLDHVQGDPFAAPSKARVQVALSEAGLPAELLRDPVRRLALEDYLAREARQAIRELPEGRRPREGPRASGRGRGGNRGRGAARGEPRDGGSGKSGLIRIDAGGQEVLDRSAVVIGDDFVEARLELGLPAAGRRILGDHAAELLLERLPALVRKSLVWEQIDGDRARGFAHCVENQEAVRVQLKARGLVAFVANGAVLPRESGASDRPLRGATVVPFRSPPELEVRFELPNPARPDVECVAASGESPHEIAGMGVPAGVTLIVGGGYHGKSTLLRALERSVHPHVPGDGREYVVSAPDLVKIRAEDGRRVEHVDIQPFIAELPGGRSTASFCSDDASGSTSQAANIVEAVEAGCTGLLLDEDTSATNFMVRDARMQALVHKEFEPITPFLERVQELHRGLGVSTVLVMGGCGDYFDVADHVIMMRDYQPRDASSEAREVAERFPGQRASEARAPLTAPTARIPDPGSFDPARGKRPVKIDARGVEEITYGTESIDLRSVEQLLDPSQTRAAGYAIHLASREYMGEATLGEVLDALMERIDRDGLDVLDPNGRGDGRHPGNLARPRRFEIAAAINRLRSLRMD